LHFCEFFGKIWKVFSCYKIFESYFAMVRPRKGRENGVYEPLTPYEKNLKSKKTLQKRRAGTCKRMAKLRRSLGVKERKALSVPKRKMAKKKSKEMARLRKQRERERKKEKVDQTIIIDEKGLRRRRRFLGITNEKCPGIIMKE